MALRRQVDDFFTHSADSPAAAGCTVTKNLCDRAVGAETPPEASHAPISLRSVMGSVVFANFRIFHPGVPLAEGVGSIIVNLLGQDRCGSAGCIEVPYAERTNVSSSQVRTWVSRGVEVCANWFKISQTS